MKLKAFALAGSAALSIALAMPAAGQTATGADRYVWDLPQEYPTDQSWERDREQVVQGIARLKELRGVAPRSAASLADVLDIMHATRGLAAHMARHAYLSSGIDTTSEKARSRLDSATALETQVEAAAAPLEEDIGSIGRDQVARWSQTEQRLRKFAHDRRLQHIFFEASHSPAPAVQPIIGSMEAWASSYGSLYDSLIQTAIKWPQIKDSRGNEFALTPDMYRTLRRDPSGQIRRQAASAFHDTAAAFETVFGTLFGRRVEADLAIARARGFDDSVVAAFTLNDAVAKSAVTQAWQRTHARCNRSGDADGFGNPARRRARPSRRGSSDFR
jgi:oligoendopeptidase F